MMFDIQMKRLNGDDACIMLRRAGVTLPLLAMSGVCVRVCEIERLRPLCL